MKKTPILFLFMMLFVINTFSFDIQASTTNNGVVSLMEDGSWKWIIQPDEYTGFNDDESQSLPGIEPETVQFDFNNFASYPVDYIGKWTWIPGEIVDITNEDNGSSIRLKTPKKTDGWIKEYGEIFIIQYDGTELKQGNSIEILVQFKKLGYKYYTSIPLFAFEDQSKVKLLD
jgi:hypothetical protein